MPGTWVTLIALMGVLMLLAIVAVDRNRLRRRLGAAEGELTGLRLDLAAARDQLDTTHSPLPDRWSPGPGQGADAEVADAPDVAEVAEVADSQRPSGL